MSSPASTDLPADSSSVTSPYFSRDEQDNKLSAVSSMSKNNISQFFRRPKTDIFSPSSSVLETFSWQSSKSNLVGERNVSGVRSFAECILDSEYMLSLKLKAHCSTDSFCPRVKYVYNPLEYAYCVHSDFLKKYCCGPKDILFLGMNPGPWGMMQTGVPFGEISIVRDWLKVNGTINVPEKQHPLRPVTGFDCKRCEVSGKRFWDLAKILSEGDPYSFFRNCFIYNYFPLSLLTESGKNLTPADLPNHVQQSVHGICDEALCDVVRRLKSKIIIAIGRFAEKRAAAAIKNNSKFASVKMEGYMEHALNVAKEALSAGEVPVGCIFVYNDNIVATGKNSVNETKNATRHAEMNCIDEVIRNYTDWKKVFRETHVIVTVEPCIMCAAALHDLEIGSIIYGCANDRFGGCVSVFDASKLYSKPCKVTGGVRADEAMSLLKTFYKGTNPNAPESKVKKKKKES